MGGLGNQMFQYAAARTLSIKLKKDIKIDMTFLLHGQKQLDIAQRDYELDIFNIQADIATPQDINKCTHLVNKVTDRIFPWFPFNPYVKERKNHFESRLLSRKTKCIYLNGHWMSERYFVDESEDIRRDFTFKKSIIKPAQEIMSLIRNTNSVCIQVRRGDYVSNATVAKVHGLSSKEYFTKGIEYIESRVRQPYYFIFSDDIEWCVDNFNFLNNVFFVEKEISAYNATNSDVLQLMTLCKHFVISNSTFGWWASWLGSYESKIVLAPLNWFKDPSIDAKDVCPPGWIRL